MCVLVCAQSPAVECWVGKKSSVARLEPISEGGLWDMKVRKKTEKKISKEKEEKEEEWKEELEMKVEKKEC